MSITYRPATAADWPAIERLLQACGLPVAGAGSAMRSRGG